MKLVNEKGMLPVEAPGCLQEMRKSHLPIGKN